MAFSAAILTSTAGAGPAVLRDLGRLLLGTVVLWTYLDFMQLLIIWESDLASDAPWYIARSTGFWGGVALLVAAGHFLLPFALLLFRRLQGSRGVLLGITTLLLVMEGVRAWWLVLPTWPHGVTWIDVACMLAVTGCAGGLAQRRRGTALVARHV